MKIKFLGHSCFLIRSENNTMIIDPFYDENRFVNLKVNYILITHAHFDHIANAEKLAKENNAIIISTPEICDYFSKKGIIKTKPMHIGSFVNIDKGFKVKFTPATHSSSIIDQGITLGVAVGIIINIDNKNIYHAGDTGLFKDMELIGSRQFIDVALLPIGGHYTMDISDAVYAVENFIKPGLTIPMHYDTFDVLKIDINNFIKDMKSNKYKIMDLGQEIEI